MNLSKLRKSWATKVLVGTMALTPLTVGTTSCDEDVLNSVIEIVSEFLSMMGYNPQAEDLDNETEGDVYDDGDSEGLPTKVSWTQYTPPVGNQGSYGTCVAWATGYGLKTTLDFKSGRIKNASVASNQTSPVDLWYVMKDKISGSVSGNCGGSSFDPAFKAMMQYGVANFSTVPFTKNQMDCDRGKPTMNSSNKLGTYRLIAYTEELSRSESRGMTPSNIKHYLAEGPIVVGAKLGERFMKWSNSNVISSDDPDSYSGGHAYHAMMVVGYDDNKGSGAFRIQNSWGATDWGDNGFIWVDYNFFCRNFAFGLWAASNDASAFTSSAASLRATTGVDVALTVLADEANTDGSRTVTFQITNNSKMDIDLEDCNVTYLVFKKKRFATQTTLFDAASEGTLARGASKVIKRTYTIPADITGEYHLFMALDAADKLGDENYADNFAFVSASGNKPLNILMGTVSDAKVAITMKDLSETNFNDYQGVELIGRLRRQANK